jgi:hypothetical protein
VEEGVADFLKRDHFERFQTVLRLAEGENADEEVPETGRELEDWMRRNVQVRVLGSVPWLAKAQLQARVGEQTLIGWLARHEIFSMPSAIGLELFPSYAFSDDWKPSRVIPEILEWLEYPSGLSTAAWFDSTSSFLSGARPRELIGIDPALVLACARNTFEIVHYI